MVLAIKQLENSQVEIEGEIAADTFETYRLRAVEKINGEVKLDGFRAGRIPERVLVKRLGEEKILLEMAELALRDEYPKLIAEKKIEAIGRPEITLTKLAKGNPLGYKVVTAVRPTLTLPDYKTIAKQEASKPQAEIKIEAKEVDDVLAELKKNPEFKEPENVKELIEKNLKHEKEWKARDKRRLEILEAIKKETKIITPEIMIQSELDTMLAEIKGETERMGLKWDDYLKHLKKEEKDLRADWRAAALKRVETGLILHEIGQAEKITPTEEELNKEVAHIKEHHKNVDEARLRAYVTGVITNEKVWQFLEGQK